jgi:hypothetical protein
MKARASILELLGRREAGRTICPSEAARFMDENEWRGLMDKVRAAGRVLADEGLIEVCQGGKPVDPREATGPIRYRLKEQP